MIIRNHEGKIIIIKRNKFKTDKQYYKEIMNIILLYNEKFESFIKSN
jgi:hypothetical protein